MDAKRSDEYDEYTVRAWTKTWFELYSKPVIRPSTAEYYERFINMRIIPKLQKKEMKLLHPDNISAYLKAADAHGVLPMFFLELTSGVRKGELVALAIQRKSQTTGKALGRFLWSPAQ